MTNTNRTHIGLKY